MAVTGDSSIEVVGTLGISGSRVSVELGLQEDMEGLRVMHNTVRVPHGGAATSVGLTLPTGVTEALLLYIRAPRTIRAKLDCADGSYGSARVKIKGDTLITFAPGGGLTALTLYNDDLTVDADVTIVTASLAASTDTTPTFWQDT